MSRLERLLRPRSVAVAGASESRSQSRNCVPALQDAGVDVHLINPRRDVLFGMRTYPDLAAIGKPVDAVLAFVNPAATLDVVRAAAEIGCGGVVVNADGFDADQRGALLAAAGADVALLGPNCNGYVDAIRGVRLSGAPRLPLLGGRVGVVTHSGGLIAAIGAAGAERRVGFSHLISTGNELQIGMAECVDFLVSDPDTDVIALIIETVRQPEAFFAALRRAHAADKPVVALKLGRSERARAIARSHTGAVTGEDWVYRAALRQHGVQQADDIAELTDRLVCLAQLPRERWSAVEGLAVLGTSGGWAALAGDIAEDEGIALRTLDSVGAAIRPILPSVEVANPLDMSGGVVNDPAAIGAVMDAYAGSSDVDTLLALWFLDDAGMDMGGALIDAAAAAAGRLPVMVASIEDAAIGAVGRGLPDRGVSVGRGIRSAMRGMASMGTHVRGRTQPIGTVPKNDIRAVAAPDPAWVVQSTAGPMLSFAAAMDLLRSQGLQVAPYVIVAPDTDLDSVVPPAAGDKFVVKLADVPHRTDIGAVRTGVAADDLAAATARMREIARDHGVPADVAVQAQVRIDGEVLLGIDTGSELGPFVACGPGGILVELGAKPVGALAPVASEQAGALLSGLDDLGVFDGVRGSHPWHREALGEAVSAMSRLAIAARGWLGTLEINPLAVVGDSFVALDCLCLLRPDAGEIRP
ncbi:acetate--CoA ligase family protein [Nocardia carnea]|uniref:acetate--CoA ligase family protein n=1 Tax=Nocardia carnea TaxID=37328 RepID=UPI0024543521|nr:acetate--CoA ligase family protein [Nocardia carnea]